MVIHEQLAAGRLYYQAGEKMAQLATGLKVKKKTKFAAPEANALFAVEAQLWMAAAPEKVPDALPQGFVEAIPEVSRDPHLGVRHQLVSFINWAVDQRLLTNDQLQWLVIQLSQPKYFYSHLQEKQSSGVFGRSLALVILRYLFYAARQQSRPIDLNTTRRLMNRLVVAMLAEKDPRGFVDRTGWVQVFAGYAGLATELCADERLNRGDKLFLLAGFLVGYQHMAGALTMGEPDEGAIFIAQLVKTHPVYGQYFINDLKRWRAQMQKLNANQAATWHRVFNYRHLLQALLMDGDLPEKVASAIMDQENDS